MLEKQHLLPDLNFDYFQGTNPSLGENLYGFKVGLKIPLFFTGQASRIKASKIAEEIAKTNQNDYNIKLEKTHKNVGIPTSNRDVPIS